MKRKKGIDRIHAKDGLRDVKISCGPGPNRLEKATRGPQARSEAEVLLIQAWRPVPGR